MTKFLNFDSLMEMNNESDRGNQMTKENACSFNQQRSEPEPKAQDQYSKH